MNFTEACAIVQDMTKRPDKINSIRAKVNAAISFYSLDNKFSRDFAEQLVSIDPTQYVQSVALSNLTRFRSFKFIKRAGTQNFLKVIGDAEIFAPCLIKDKYYIVGDSFNINMTCLAASLDVGYWMYPPVLNDQTDKNSYWLLDTAPWMIIDRTAAEIFREIGEERSSQLLKQSAAEQYIAARKDLGISTQ